MEEEEEEGGTASGSPCSTFQAAGRGKEGYLLLDSEKVLTTQRPHVKNEKLRPVALRNCFRAATLCNDATFGRAGLRDDGKGVIEKETK